MVETHPEKRLIGWAPSSTVTRGLGRAYAKRLAGVGAKVAVADLNLRS
jgi:hypothetical protein